jgi:hypothetical protein
MVAGLNHIVKDREAPKELFCGNGSEFTNQHTKLTNGLRK